MLKYVLHLVELNFAFTYNPKFPVFCGYALIAAQALSFFKLILFSISTSAVLSLSYNTLVKLSMIC